jgi:cytochrome c biogenesis protein CcmG/thiol:disulfide interchange protein DsbE
VKRRVAILALIPFSALVIVSLLLLTRQNPAPASFTSPVRPAPQFDVPSLDGGQVKLSDFKGRPVVVNLWATWCAPCKLEHPLLVKMAQEENVEILGILYKDPKGMDAARELLVREGNPFAKIGLDPIGDLGLDIGISGVPESFLIDANGVIVKTQRNYFTPETAEAFVAAYRAELAKPPAPAPVITPPPGG